MQAAGDSERGADLSGVLARPWVMHTIGVLSVLSLYATLGRGSFEAWDLRLLDGSWYFGWSRDIARYLRFPTWENAPLYCLYYAFFHKLFGSVFVVYYAHRASMLLLIDLLSYALFSRLFTPALAVAGVAYLQLLIEEGNIATYAVRPFVLIPFLTAACLATRRERWSAPAVLLSLFWAAGCRPEWWVCLPVATLGLTLLQLGAARGTADTKARRLAFVTLAVAVCASIFTANVTSRSPRSWLAFGQHFAFGYARRHPSPSGPDPGLHWQQYLRTSFGDAGSVSEALMHNPRELLQHVLQNARFFPSELAWALEPQFRLYAWLEALVRPLNMLWVSFAALALGVLGLRVRGASIRHLLRDHAYLLIVMLAAALAVSVSALVVIPQAVYMYALSASLLLGVLGSIQVWIGPWLETRPLAPLCALLVTSLLTLMLCPTPYDRTVPRIVYPAVQALPRIAGNAPYGLIADSASSFCIYADDPRCQAQELLWADPQPSDPARYVESENTRLLLISKRLREQVSPAWSRYLEAIIADPESQGWRKVAPAPGEEAMIAIYQRLASPEQRPATDE